jgi:CarD family transcriptional regulator
VEEINKNETEYNYSYKINDYVSYRKNGIYRIIDIRSENKSGTGDKIYYVMKSVYNDNDNIRIFVPVDSVLVSEMNSILTVDEINSIIASSEELPNKWIEDNKLRALSFEQIFSKGDRAEILWLVKVLSIYKLKLEQNKKVLNTGDTKILSTAVKMIEEEFAFALGISKNEVIPYILNRIEQAQIK